MVLSVNSLSEIPGMFGVAGPATMIIRCEQNTTSAYVTFNGLFMADIQSYGRVDVRIDQRTARQVSMRESSDNSALGLWRGNTAIPFVRDLFGGDQLFLRATPFNDSRIDMIFPITGLEQAISPLRQACNW
ncbi:type VI secretion protein [Pararhodobacter zhoushanensis]|uniref:Type VI secretion protein n=1 Tax=Pararhodobacter zhoushanensis TaxID=2479545 RepID=A0ABT3GYS5_9RHOB|nr:type VI secretion protein [Pararhodobacter zhoushanensis]MCW1932638.1 type VI secretion protein [Pararhodobacter zhoushanensis]